MTPIKRIAQTTAVLVVPVLLIIVSCKTSEKPSGQATAEVAPLAKGGAQLWGENCARCHNMRSPSIYSDAEWDVAMAHMRVRANLTADEYKKIQEFLKSSN
jgi:cytochrome c5